VVDGVTPGFANNNNAQKPGPDGTYFSGTGNSIRVNNNSWTNISGSYVVFVDGDLDIGWGGSSPDITVNNPGGFLAFVVNGNINIHSNVTKVQGIYIANGTINIIIDPKKFNGEGTFVGWGGVSLNRDVGLPDNLTIPSEMFTYRPDLLLNAPDEFKKPKYEWQEVNP
jgi:hypothetical protein